MSKSRLEWRVGLFVMIGLVLLAGLVIQFSKGIRLTPKYTIIMRAANVGGMKTKASVLMSGVQVGIVRDIKLGPQGTNVSIWLTIYKEYQIHKDARFLIEQSGFLGDEYVSIRPTENNGPIFGDMDVVEAESPLNMQEVARSAAGFLQRIDETAKKLNGAIADVRKLLLNENTLTNLAVAVDNMRTVSERALNTVDGLNGLVSSNATAFSQSGSNLVYFTTQMNEFSGGLSSLVQTNSPTLNQAVRNIETATATLTNVMIDLQKGQGLAGNLLKNEKLAADVSLIASNMSIASSNLNRLGLWGIMWKKKPPPKDAHEGKR
jgi:phospholipid/cholesterol/gamma-HCH transport system substrate-binding protein